MLLRDRGTCPECGRNMKLRKNGRMRYHGGLVGTIWNGRRLRAYCTGTNQRPKEITA